MKRIKYFKQEKSIMRILHFSDFHLNGNKVQEAKQILKYMLDALKKIKEETPIDLVIFSGDMLERGGEGYNGNLNAGFLDFKEKIITPIMSTLELPYSRFIFCPGNHDINREADDELVEEGIESRTKEYNDIVSFAKGTKIGKYTARVDDFKEFENKYYGELDDVKYHGSRFVSTFEYDINGTSVGISSLNDIWRCGFDDKNKIALGIHQITENTKHLEGKSLRIAVMHYPIEFLKETERHIVIELCARNFDVVFCGHSHQGYVNMHVPLNNDAFLEVNTSGTLAANTYINDSKYQNSFQIVNCEACVRYSVQKYVQQSFQDFILEINDEYPDGNNVRHYPNKLQFESRYRAYIEDLRKTKEQHIAISISPFVSLDDFLTRPNNIVMKSAFVKGNKIGHIMDEIRSSVKDCRLMALSGMGKTRIIAETFRGMNDVYYSNIGMCTQGLNALLKFKEPKVIVVDNCNGNALREAQKCIDESGKNVRLITLHNVLIPSEQGTRGELIILDYNDTKEIVETMLAMEASIQGKDYLINAIRERSGNIPYMTVLLLEAYRKNNNLSIDNADNVLSAILKGNESIEENKGKVLKTLSLFDPLGYENGIKDEYNYVTHNGKIHHIALNQEPIDILFEDTINEYLDRQLVEKEGYCVRVRPRPLAEWLTESWLIEFGDNIPDILDDIVQLGSNLSDRLFRALNNRFKEMSTSKNANKVFETINNPENGSFHNERIAFSKAGSQLFLSMGVVSPVMVAKNLCSLVEVKSIEWLQNEMDLDARRNLVWALENICMDADAFVYGAKCLAKLAIAESESISNNATGQFLQLFHLFLSGTQANLKERISLIQFLREDESYLPLLIKAIDSAFVTRGFCRTNTNGVQKYSDTPDDYQPTIQEVKFYWRDCVDVLTYITNQKPELCQLVLDMLPKHVGDFANLRELQLLYKLIEHYGDAVNYQWPEMRDNLSLCLQYWFKGTIEQCEELKSWLKRLAPRTLLGRIKASIKDDPHKINGDYKGYEQKMLNQMEPFAEEFLNSKIYESPEFEDIILDNQMHVSWFICRIAKKMDEKCLTKDVYKGVMRVVLKQPKAFDCNFVPSLVSWTKDTEIINTFRADLLVTKYLNLYSSVTGVIDNETYPLLKEMIKGYNDGLFDNNCINNYLRYYRHQTIQNILEIFDLLNGACVSGKDVCYPYVLDRLQYHVTKDDGTAYEKYQEVLLSFDFNNSYPHLSSQVVDAMCDVLSGDDAQEFAKNVNQKAIDYLSKSRSVSHPFDRLYSGLLPKYQNDILEGLCEVLSSEDEYVMFYYSMYNYLGSGFYSGAGPLFQCNNEILKDACRKHPSVLPQRFAQMCPVYNYSESGKEQRFSDFFLWLCDNFGNQKEMLHAFSSNMGTFSWSGSNGFSNYIAKRIPCIMPLLSHSNKTVREWAASELDSVKKEVIREQGNEAYERMVRG